VVQRQGLVVRGQGQGLKVQGLVNWSSSILKDKDFPQGQQHDVHEISETETLNSKDLDKTEMSKKRLETILRPRLHP